MVLTVVLTRNPQWQNAARLDPSTYIAAWALFCVSVFVNVHFSYWESMLRGVGDFVGVN